MLNIVTNLLIYIIVALHISLGKYIILCLFDQYDALLAEAEFFQIQPMISQIRHVTGSHVVTLNVGGTTYSVSENLLAKYPTSNLYRMVTTSRSADRNGTCFIDGDGDIFKHVLTFLRRDELILPSDFKGYVSRLSRAGFPDRYCLIIIINKSICNIFLKLAKQFKTTNSSNFSYRYFVTSCDFIDLVHYDK